MTFKKNTRIIGQHAFLSPSNYEWLNYDEDKLKRVYRARQQTRRGTEEHAYAQQAIQLGIKQADNGSTLSLYINDCIGYRLQPEVPLYYSDDCFGTADAAGVRQERSGYVLRINDLKTGVTPASMSQLLIYAGIFFFEYAPTFTPQNTKTILRIYQNNAFEELIPEFDEIMVIMSRIKTAAQVIAYMREED
jgi:hypothetical protein